MVFLKRTTSGPPRKRAHLQTLPSSTTTSSTSSLPSGPQEKEPPPPNSQTHTQPPTETPTLVSVLADCGCTLLTPSLPSDLPSLRSRLHSRLSSSPSLLSRFLSELSLHLRLPLNLHRFLLPASSGDISASRSDSLARVLLLVAPLQLHLQILLLEKLPEHFDSSPPGSSLEDDVARLIVNHLRWLDFLVDPETFAEKLMEVVSISPSLLRKEIVGSLPEIVGDRGNTKVVAALEEMLREDVEIIVPVLDALSNLNLDEELQERGIDIALSCIATVDADNVPHLLRFLMMVATGRNVGRIVSRIREQLQFVSMPEGVMAGGDRMMKGKNVARTAEAAILEALKSGLRFKNMLCKAILKELKSLRLPQDHKVIDIWLLVLIYANGGSLQKTTANILKRKIVEGCLQEHLFNQCVYGQRELVKDNLSTFLSICEYMLSCKEKPAREVGVCIYAALFKEFADRCSRQEVLGALVTHIGSGVAYEVNSALEAILLLASKYAQELDPFFPHIHGILDYLEGFSDESLRKVYEIFCLLSLHAKSNGDAIGSMIANELLMIVRKQVGNPDIRYRKMGIIGTIRIVSMLGDKNATSNYSFSQKSNSEEALQLLKMSWESCKSASISLVSLYDELIALVHSIDLQPPVLEWVGKTASEFEPIFLADLERGKLPSRDLSSCLEGEPWMNLDGDISPVCLDILQLLSCPQQQTSSVLLLLPAHFLLLSAVEMSANQGSLGGIDALLGCPIHLPSRKYFGESSWKALNGDTKKIILLSLYYAVNWMRELVNVFSTQISGVDVVSQTAREEITLKLLKRLRNLVYLESLLNLLLKHYPIILPELQIYMKHSGFFSEGNNVLCDERFKECRTTEGAFVSRKRGRKKSLKAPEKPDDSDKLKQPTIVELFKKAGVITTQDLPKEGLGSSTSSLTPQVAENHVFPEYCLDIVDVCTVPSLLERQRLKLRPLHISSLSILSCSQRQDSCCSDSASELPLHLYLLRDFHRKLDYLSSSGRALDTLTSLKFNPSMCRMSPLEFLTKVHPLFPSLRKHFDVAVAVLEEGHDVCHEHWKSHSASAGNPEISYLMVSKFSAANHVLREILCCYRKMLNCPDLYTSMGLPILRQLLGTFQPDEVVGACLGAQPNCTTRNLGYLYRGAFSFLENAMDIACSFSFLFASEVLLVQESVASSIPSFFCESLDRDGNSSSLGLSKELHASLQKKIAISAHKILACNWSDDDKNWKGRDEIIQKVLCMYLNNSESTSSLLVHLGCSVLPQVPFVKSKDTADVPHDFPTLGPITFSTWYKVLHEVNIELLSKLVKDVLTKHGTCPSASVSEVIIELHCFVDVIVSLVSMCRINDKVTVHAMAIKYGGKFVDVFIKAFNFLEAHFQMHNDSIIQMLKKLQKATRTIHTLCSEAKGLRRTMITCKIPSTKRSMERFLFRVKALLHRAADGCGFWLGNLKHKDLHGHEVSSQVYMDGDGEPYPSE